MARLTHWKQPSASSPDELEATTDDPSMTFQIPHEAGHATRLLDMGDDDFLDGCDDSFGSPERTPQHHTIAQPPLTLEELTPRKRLKSNLRGALSSKLYAESTPFLKRERFSPVRRTRATEDEENVQPDDVVHTTTTTAPVGQPSPPPSPKRPSHAATRPKTREIALDDDIASLFPPERRSAAKTRLPDVLHSVAKSVESGPELIRPEDVAQTIVDSEREREPLSAPSVDPGTSRETQRTRKPSSSRNEVMKAPKVAPGNAARPNKTAPASDIAGKPAPAPVRPKAAKPIRSTVETVKPRQAGEKRTEVFLPPSTASDAKSSSGTVVAPSSAGSLESHGGPSESASVSRPSTPPTQERRPSSPLTLSKLSPSKQTPNAVLSSRSPACPGRSAERASSPVVAASIPPTKPASSARIMSDQTAKQPPTERAQDVSPQVTVPSVASAPTAGPSRAKPATKVLAGKPQAKKQTARRRSSVQRSYCKPSVTAKQKTAPRPGALTAKRRAGLLDQEQAGTSVRRREPGLASSGEGKKPTQRLTKPIEFHFKVESRLSARKPSGGQDAPETTTPASRLPRDPSIPDFSARHAHEAERTLARKERVAPTVPHSPEFTLDARLREREKFEEARRAREAEIEQQRERAKLEREREEEVEMRRLRKLAVPKANAVPDWYAHAPKKSNRSASSSTSGPA